jgi:hypothetical protein
MNKLKSVKVSDGRVIKVGDWLMQEYAVKQVIEDITQYDNGAGPAATLSDGMFQISGCDMLERTRPLTRRNLAIAHTFKYQYDYLHRLNDNSINWPDLARWLEQKWLDACDTPERKGENEEKELSKIFTELNDMVKQIETMSKEKKKIVVDGLKVFK